MSKTRRTIKPSARVGTISRARAHKAAASASPASKPSGGRSQTSGKATKK